MLLNVKMPTIVGILTFMSMINVGVEVWSDRISNPSEILWVFRRSIFHFQWWDLAEIQVIQGLICILVTCNNEEDSSSNEGSSVVTTFLPLQVCKVYTRLSMAANYISKVGSGRISNSLDTLWLSLSAARMIWSNSEPIVVLVTCNNEESKQKSRC